MHMKVIALVTAAAGGLALSACGSSAFKTQMTALCMSPPGNPNRPGLIGGRDCTCTVAALDAGLTSEQKQLLLTTAIMGDNRQSPAARQQAADALRTAGIDPDRRPDSGSTGALFEERMEELTRDIRRNCPRSSDT